MKVNKDNFNLVMNNILDLYDKGDNDEKDLWCDYLDSIIDELRGNDFFGTEGQCDPRGDNRNT